jgi:hypothetical protein
MTIKIEKISASVYKVINNYYGPDFVRYYDTERRLVSGTPSFLYDHTRPMSNDDWDMLKSWCKAQDVRFPNREPEPDTLSNYEPYWTVIEGTEPTTELPTFGYYYLNAEEPETLPVVKHVPADSVNVTLANADKGMYRIEWRNSESGKTRFIVHCFGCANSLQVARGIAFAQCAKVTHPMSKPTTDLSDHP